MQGAEGISINLDLWSLGYAVDDRIRLLPEKRKGQRTGQLSDSQKTAARMRQRAFPSLLCNILSKSINGETNCIGISHCFTQIRKRQICLLFADFGLYMK